MFDMSRVTTQPLPDCRFFVVHESDVPHVTTGAHAFCMQNGFDHLMAAHVATATSELANNLWMHTERGGHISLRCCQDGGRHGIEVVAEDEGPGIADLTLALSEGWSSAGGMGCGLPGVRRLMDNFEIESAPGRGTIVLARKWAPSLAPMPLAGRSESPRDANDRLAPVSSDWRLDVAMLCVPMDGETVCGDVCVSLPLPIGGGHWLAVVDGLGHGEMAAAAAQRAQQEITHQALSAKGAPAALLRQLDGALCGTRGAAVGLAWVDGHSLSFAGMGNTRMLRWRHGQVVRMPSQPGIVGEGHLRGRAWPTRQEHLSLMDGDWLVMYSDGLHEMLQLDVMLPAWQARPSNLARHLLDRWRQAHDDAAVLVARLARETP